jgi:hypothetical protein
VHWRPHDQGAASPQGLKQRPAWGRCDALSVLLAYVAPFKCTTSACGAPASPIPLARRAPRVPTAFSSAATRPLIIARCVPSASAHTNGAAEGETRTPARIFKAVVPHIYLMPWLLSAPASAVLVVSPLRVPRAVRRPRAQLSFDTVGCSSARSRSLPSYRRCSPACARPAHRALVRHRRLPQRVQSCLTAHPWCCSRPCRLLLGAPRAPQDAGANTNGAPRMDVPPYRCH